MLSLDVGLFIFKFLYFLCKNAIGLCRDPSSAVLSTVNISKSVLIFQNQFHFLLLYLV